MRKLLVCWFFILTGSVALAQDTVTINPELKTYLESLERMTTDIRSLPTLSDVDLFFPTHDELRAYVAEQMEKSLDAETLEKLMAFYTAFDFMSPDLDLYQTIVNLYEQQIAGFYDSETRHMNVILITGETPETTLPLLEQIVFVHEFTHALQDQHFGLDEYLELMEAVENDDRALARQALVEGDATYVMMLYTIRVAQDDPGAALLELLRGSLQSGSLSLPPGTPIILTAELLFPYEGGQLFVEALMSAGGWELVNQAYEHPPESTEQVIHPQKYIDGEQPVEVTLPEDDTFPAEGWSLVHQGVMGEFYMRQYLRTLLSLDSAIQAAAGWGGDRYQIYRSDSSGAQAWRLKIVWDTEADRDEFKAAFEEFMTKRTGSPALDSCHASIDLTLCAEYSGNSVLITSVSAGLINQ